MKRKQGIMSLNTFSSILDDCIQFGIPIRLIRWGEPFLHPHIIEWSRKIKEAGLPLHITNNGLIISGEQMQELVDMKLDSIIFSMQGATKDGYEKMRNNDQYDKLHDNIMTMVKIRGDKELPYIQVSSTMTDETEKEISKFKKYWEKIVDKVVVGKTTFGNLGKEVKWYLPCNEVWQKLSVDWDGKVTACCADYDNLLTIGDIKDSSLIELWNGKNLKAIRTLLENKKHKELSLCSKCEYAYFGI